MADSALDRTDRMSSYMQLQYVNICKSLQISTKLLHLVARLNSAPLVGFLKSSSPKMEKTVSLNLTLANLLSKSSTLKKQLTITEINQKSPV